jgi:hypothetical protein
MNGDLCCFLVRIKSERKVGIIMAIRNYLVFRHHLMVVLNRQTELVAITVVVSKLWLHLLAQTQMGAGRDGWL